MLGNGGAAPPYPACGHLLPAGEKGRFFWFWCYKDVAPTALGRGAGARPPRRDPSRHSGGRDGE